MNCNFQEGVCIRCGYKLPEKLRGKNVHQACRTGFGDTIKEITDYTGITTVVKTIFGENCGCEKRKEQLNHLFPYNHSQ